MTDPFPSEQRYTPVAIALHWLMALLVLGLFALGIYMADLQISPQKLKFYSYHKWAGVTVFMLVLLRIFWRLRHPPPPFPTSIALWQQRAAHVGHMLLYTLLLAAPLSGWVMSSAHGFTTVWFGVLPLPNLLGKDPALAETLKLVHRYLNYSFIVVVAGHVFAALEHHFLHRDSTLTRMLPMLRTRREKAS